MGNAARYSMQIAQAESYVRTRFFPPLPVEYGRLAVEAVEACWDSEPDRPLDVTGLNPEPRGSYDGDDGRRYVAAGRVWRPRHRR